MGLLVFVQGCGLGKGFSTDRVRADKGPVSGMASEVHVPGVDLFVGLAAAFKETGKGPFSGMCQLVLPQSGRMGKGAPTAFPAADKRPLSGVYPVVHPQACAPCKGSGAAGLRTDERPVSAVNGCVFLQVAAKAEVASTVKRADKVPVSCVQHLMGFQSLALPEGSCAALIRAAIGLFTAMDQSVSCQRARLYKGPLAAFIRTQKGFFPGMNAYMPFQVMFFPEHSPAPGPEAQKAAAGGLVIATHPCAFRAAHKTAGSLFPLAHGRSRGLGAPGPGACLWR